MVPKCGLSSLVFAFFFLGFWSCLGQRNPQVLASFCCPSSARAVNSWLACKTASLVWFGRARTTLVRLFCMPTRFHSPCCQDNKKKPKLVDSLPRQDQNPKKNAKLLRTGHILGPFSPSPAQQKTSEK